MIISLIFAHFCLMFLFYYGRAAASKTKNRMHIHIHIQGIIDVFFKWDKILYNGEYAIADDSDLLCLLTTNP